MGVGVVGLLVGLGLCVTSVPGSADDVGRGLFAPTRDALEAARGSLVAATTTHERAQLLLDVGDPSGAATLLAGLPSLTPADERLLFEIQLALGEFDLAGATIQGLDPNDPEDRKLWYRWWFVVDDLARAQQEVEARLLPDADLVVDRLAAGRLRLSLLEPAESEVHYARALGMATTPEERAAALRGLSGVAFKLRDFDRSWERLVSALEETPLEADLLQEMSGTLIRLGRTEEAIEAVEFAVDLAPYHESAHYSLGNGYARKNYTQLFAAYPDAFADEEGRAALASADEKLAGGDRVGAREAYEAVRKANPEWADVLVRLGSLEFSLGEHRKAREYFEASLARCPEYGRAHNGLAKALEGERLAVEVHRDAYERDFGSRETPQIPRIEEFVVNWNALSPRHQKQVALSVEPWKRYLPVLIEGGLTYYIKPLYELLSETPGQHTLRDLRISYDSRLWDDVRGCGGYHTVTGVEDVERTILGRYNTVLHELTHQVHGVLPTESSRGIQELYRATKVREEETGDAFLSRYAGGSVWEYFAEGANAWKSPRRDEFDTREIVLERLGEMDPDLEELVVELAETAPIEPCFPVAWVGRGEQDLEDADPEGAIQSYRRALEYDETEPRAMGALVYALQLTGETADAVTWAERATMAHPDDGDLARGHADAVWHDGQGLGRAIGTLGTARESVREEDRYRVDLELGRLLWTAGDAPAAIAAYDRVLEYQADNPDALWGRASSLALAEDWTAAWQSYDEAVRHRTGVVKLRCDYARDLLRAGAMGPAREQIDAALLLDEEEPEVRALDAWWTLAGGDPESAYETAEAALAESPWCTLARMVQARAAASLGRQEEARSLLEPLHARFEREAPPRYVFREKWGRYDEVETHPEVERRLLEGVLGID